jgi:outer membrane biosynthesis protein TonB
MTPDHDERDDEYLEDEAPRSIFAATWFRVVLVVLVLGVVGAIAVPYVLSVVQAPPTTTASTASPPGSQSAGARAVTTPAEPAKPLPPTAVPSAPPPTPATPKPAPASPSADKPSEPKPAVTAPEPPRPAMSAKAAESAKPAAPVKAMESAKPPAPAKVAESTRRAPAAESARPSESVKSAERARTAGARSTTADGDYFVQVGAFGDEAVAKRVAGRLRESGYPVVESVKRTATSAPVEPPRPASPRASTAAQGDRYDVLVSGGAAAEINTKLAAKGLATEPAGDGVRIRPSLPLRDAVALSKDLGSEGFKVQVRRGGGGGSEPVATAASVSSGTTGGAVLHRVRVGGYPDRAAAQAALRELSEKGFDGFIAKGRD